ncbi:hypothetical protein ACTA71_005810 [Dictyostelium dimigraforme]
MDHGEGKGTGMAIVNRDTRKGYLSINFQDEDGRLPSSTHEGITNLINSNKNNIKTLDNWLHFKNKVIREYLKKDPFTLRNPKQILNKYILKSRAKDGAIFQIKDSTEYSQKIHKVLPRPIDLKEDNELTHIKLLNGWNIDKEIIKEQEVDINSNSKEQSSSRWYYSTRDCVEGIKRIGSNNKL